MNILLQVYKKIITAKHMCMWITHSQRGGGAKPAKYVSKPQFSIPTPCLFFLKNKKKVNVLGVLRGIFLTPIPGNPMPMQCVFEKSQTKAFEVIEIIIFYLCFEIVLLQNQFAVHK